MKKVGVLIIFALFLVSAVFSIPLRVSWLEGTVMVRSGTSWKPLDMGVSVDSLSVIQLKSDSFVEFSYSGGKLALGAEGIHNLNALLAKAVNHQQERSSVLAKVGKLVTNQAPRSSTVAGVRGSEQDSSASIEWILEDEAIPSGLDPAREAYAFVQRGDYLRAARAFSVLISSAPAETKMEYQYGQAWCLASDNDLVGSIKLLRSMPNAGPFAIQRALLLARLNLDTGAIMEAVQVLESVWLSTELQSDDQLLVQKMLQEAKTLQSQ